MVGASKEAKGESGNRIEAPAVKERCKHFGTVVIPPIAITLKADALFRKFVLLLYKILTRNNTLSENGTQAVEFGSCEED